MSAGSSAAHQSFAYGDKVIGTNHTAAHQKRLRAVYGGGGAAMGRKLLKTAPYQKGDRTKESAMVGRIVFEPLHARRVLRSHRQATSACAGHGGRMLSARLRAREHERGRQASQFARPA